MKNENKVKNLKPLSTKELKEIKGGNGTSTSVIGTGDIALG